MHFPKTTVVIVTTADVAVVVDGNVFEKDAILRQGEEGMAPDLG